MKDKISIAVFGHYGHQNYGDEAIITATLENFKNIIPGVKLYCFSLDPKDSEKNHCIPSFPIKKYVYDYKAEISAPNKSQEIKQPENSNPSFVSNLKGLLKKIKPLVVLVRTMHGIKVAIKTFPTEAKFLKEAYKSLDGIDLLLVTGSNQFLDNFGGTTGFPYTLLKWSVLCKLRNIKVAFASVGAGPLDKFFSKFFIHLSILGSKHLSFRDLNSKKLVEKTIFPIRGSVYPDIAHSLQFKSKNVTDIPKVIGINPMPVYDKRYWYIMDDHLYDSYVDRLARFIEKISQKGYQVFLFNTMEKDINVANDILKLLPEKVKNKVENKIVDSVPGLMNAIDSADLVIPTRFHGTILSLVAEKPVLGISYYRKTRDILREMGQEKYAVDIEDFTVEDLLKSFNKRLSSNIESEKTLEI